MSAGVRIDAPEIGELSSSQTGQMLREVANAMLTSAQLSFHNSSDPHGNKWPALSPKTIAKRRNNSDVPLRDTGVLMRSLQVSDVFQSSEGMAIEAGSDMEYASIHNFGGFAGKGKKAKIPQRQFMPDPDNLPEDITADILDLGASVVMRSVFGNE